MGALPAAATVQVWSRGKRNLQALWARMLAPAQYNTSYTGIDVCGAARFWTRFWTIGSPDVVWHHQFGDRVHG
jgi:hypothetical protein